MSEEELRVQVHYRMVEALAEAEQQRRRMMEEVSDGLILLDADGVVCRINAQACLMLRMTLLPGDSARDLLRQLGLGAVVDAMRARCPISGHRLSGPQGRELSVSTAMLPGEQGPDWLLTLRDITDPVSAEHSRQRFLCYFSHELRTPLTSIQGYTSLLMEEIPGPLNATQKEFLALIQQEGQRLGELIERLVAAAGARGAPQEPWDGTG